MPRKRNYDAAVSAAYRGLFVAELITVDNPNRISPLCLCTWVATNGVWRLKYRSRMCPDARVHG
jgi:hypothetical protein